MYRAAQRPTNRTVFTTRRSPVCSVIDGEQRVRICSEMGARSILWSSRILTSSGAVADTALAWELVQGQGRESAPGLARAAHIRPRLKPERRHGPPPAAAAAPQRAASKRLLFGGRRAAHRRRAPGRRWAAEFLRCWGVRAQNQAAVYLEGGSSEPSTEPPSGAPARWASRSFSLRGS